MGFFNEYPYTDMHELNADWILKEVGELHKSVDNFISTMKIKYANPIEWSTLTNYEPNTVVLGEDGNTYISLKYVPTGVLYTNNEYWQKIADFNAQLTVIDNKVNQLESTISLTVNRKYIFIGDSYGASESEGGLPYSSWIDHVASNMNLSPDSYYKVAHGGAGFCGSYGGYTFLTKLQSYSDIISNKGEITDIIICGGTNDQSFTSENIYNNMIAFVNYCKSTYPNAHIKLGEIGFTSNTTNRIKIYGTVLPTYRLITRLGGEYLNNSECILHDYGLLNSDGVHPTQDGEVILGAYLTNCIMNGSSDISILSSGLGYTTPANVSLSYQTMSTQRDNSTCRLKSNTVFDMTFTEGITLPCNSNFNNGVKVMSITSGEFCSCNNVSIITQGYVTDNLGNTTHHSILMNCYLDELYISLSDTTTPINNVVKITFLPFELSTNVLC